MALGTYNRTPANRIGGTQEFAASYSMFGNMAALMGVGATYAASYQMAGDIAAEMTLFYGYEEAYAMTGSITATANPVLRVFPAYTMTGSISGAFRPVLNAAYSCAGALTATMPLKIVIYPKYGTFYGSLTGYVSGIQTREYAMAFDSLVIPSGSVLVIDMENFTATLDGENVIDLYSGDWFEFTRKLQGIDVESGTSGDFGISVLYRERYL
jgi:hypothetical protein